MLTAGADIRTEHAATYLARLCGHAGKMGTVGRRLGHRRLSHARGASHPRARGMLPDRGDRQPGLGPVDHEVSGGAPSVPRQPTGRACGGSRIC